MGSTKHALGMVKPGGGENRLPKNHDEWRQSRVPRKGRKAFRDFDDRQVEPTPIGQEPDRRYDACVYGAIGDADSLVVTLQHDFWTFAFATLSFCSMLVESFDFRNRNGVRTHDSAATI